MLYIKNGRSLVNDFSFVQGRQKCLIDLCVEGTQDSSTCFVTSTGTSGPHRGRETRNSLI